MRVLAVGGGFSGTAFAIHLLRLAEQKISLTLLDRREAIGEGAAYGTKRREHVLNVPVKKMSCIPDIPDHLLKWLEQHAAQVGLDAPARQPGSFIPREVYSRYLKSTLQTEAARSAKVQMRTVHDEAVSACLGSQSALQVSMASGEQLEADRVVICLGNEPSRWPFPIEGSSGSIIENPWSYDTSTIPSNASVLVVGSGLSMADVVVTLSKQRHTGRITAVSRRGIMPKSHGPELKAAEMWFADKPRRSAMGLYCEVMNKVTRHTSLGGDWRDAVDGLRPWTPQLWRSLSDQGKRTFVSLGKASWDFHRHRVAPEIHAVLQEQLDRRRFQVLAAQVQGLKVLESGKVQARLGGEDGPEDREFDYVINCTGPNADVWKSSNPLLESLLARGLALPGRSGLGVQVSDAGRLITQQGEAPALWAVGPLLMDRDFESTAVPELRVQAQTAAQGVLSS